MSRRTELIGVLQDLMTQPEGTGLTTEFWTLANEDEVFEPLVEGQTLMGFGLEYKQAIDDKQFDEAQQLAQHYLGFVTEWTAECKHFRLGPRRC